MDGKLTLHEQGEANEYCFINQGNKWLIAFRMNGEKTVFSKREIARRLVVCWNACEGLPTELIEKHGVTRSGIAKGTAALEQQRDDLLAACEAAARYDSAIRRRGNDGDYSLDPRGAVAEGHDLDALYDEWMRKSLAAIANVKGQCGKINGGHACTMPAGHKCPDCGLSLHDVPEGA